MVTGIFDYMFGVVFSLFSGVFAAQKPRITAASDARNRDEKGFVLAFTCLSIIVLTAIGGIAVDLGSWYWNAQRLQRAADAAALAGAPYLPGNPPAAFAAAKITLEQNGVHVSSTDTHVVPGIGADKYKPSAYIGQDPLHPSILNVEVGITVKNYLLGLIGVNDEYLVRHGNGVYKTAVPMGSPGNVLGSEPTQPNENSVQSDADAYNAHYWLNISGGQTDKVTGDRYTAGKCTSTTDGCGPTGVNAEIGNATNTGGTTGKPLLRAHQYIVHIPSTVTSFPVTLQAFDAAYVDVGDHCDSANTYGAGLGSAALISLGSQEGDSALYAKGPASKYCTGDFNQGFNGTAPTLKFKVDKADKNGNAVTGGGFTTIATGAFPGLKFSSSTNLAAYLNSHDDLRNSFRKWSDVAKFNESGDYLITATTPDDSAGTNRFSLRLGVDRGTINDKRVWDTSLSDQISVYAKYALSVYTNSSAADTSFYFARLTDNVAGRDLTIELYDIGDVPSGESVDLQLLPPSGATGRLHTYGFEGCTQKGPGTFSDATLPGCTIFNASSSAGYNGKVVRMQIHIPPDYQCTDDGSKRCWMSLRFNLHGAGGISASNPSTDTTTWQIIDCGAPVKLVKDGWEESTECSSEAL